MADFTDLDSTVDYDIAQGNHVAKIDYTYSGAYVGSAYVNLAEYTESTYDFETGADTADIDTKKANTSPGEDDGTIFINIKKVLIGTLIFMTVVICIFIIRAVIINNNNSKRRRNRVTRKKHRRERIRSNFDDFDF